MSTNCKRFQLAGQRAPRLYKLRMSCQVASLCRDSGHFDSKDPGSTESVLDNPTPSPRKGEIKS